ncbi:MAG: MurR/RpiR family transcriptional regulator [Spirochaetales bacterium]|nr:MurR/RpiR family transcriptional regulator [Spirochaetales bacterium]
MEIEKINAENLTESQRLLADYFSRNNERIAYLSIEEIAASVNMSTATVSRFAKFLGYSTFKELKDSFRKSHTTTPHSKLQDRLEKLEGNDIISALWTAEIDHLKSTEPLLDRDAFNRAVQALAQADTVCLYGNGSSAALMELLGFRLNRFKKHIHRLGRDASSMAEALIHLGPKTVVVAAGFLKERPRLEKVFKLAEEAQSPTILITDLRVSRLTEAADIVLTINRGEPGEFHSMVAPVALIDGLIIALAGKESESSGDTLEELQRIKARLS